MSIYIVMMYSPCDGLEGGAGVPPQPMDLRNMLSFDCPSEGSGCSFFFHTSIRGRCINLGPVGREHKDGSRHPRVLLRKIHVKDKGQVSRHRLGAFRLMPAWHLWKDRGKREEHNWMGEAWSCGQIVHQRRPASSGRSGLALVMAWHSWSLAQRSLGRVCLQSKCCRGGWWCRPWTPPSRFWAVHPVATQGDFFSGGCTDLFICPAIQSKLCLIVTAMVRVES